MFVSTITCTARYGESRKGLNGGRGRADVRTRYGATILFRRLTNKIYYYRTGGDIAYVQSRGSCRWHNWWS